MKESLAEAISIPPSDRPVTSRSLRSMFRDIQCGRPFNQSLAKKILEVAVLERDTYRWYLRQLALVTNAQHGDLDSISDEMASEIMQSRFESLSESDLRRIAVNPVAIIQIADQVNEYTRDAWDSLEAAIDSALRPKSPVQPAKDQPPRRSQDNLPFSFGKLGGGEDHDFDDDEDEKPGEDD